MSTIKDIARMAGISPSTVSVVLNGKATERKISTATQQKIWDAVRVLDYKPNISARRLREATEQALVVAIFWTTDFRASMMIRFLRGIHQALRRLDRQIEIAIHLYDNDELHNVAALQSLNLFHAAIICNASRKDMLFLESTHLHFPLVLYNRYSEKYATVNVDDEAIGAIAAAAFAKHGRTCALAFTAPSVFQGMTRRTIGFNKALEQNGLLPAQLIESENSMKGGYDTAWAFIKKTREPNSENRAPVNADCIFFASDTMAIGALKAFAEAGVQIPEEIELISVGNGDPEWEQFASTSLSVVHLPMEEMADTCLNLLLDVVEHRIDVPHAIHHPVHYIPRESCGPL